MKGVRQESAYLLSTRTAQAQQPPMPTWHKNSFFYIFLGEFAGFNSRSVQCIFNKPEALTSISSIYTLRFRGLSCLLILVDPFYSCRASSGHAIRQATTDASSFFYVPPDISTWAGDQAALTTVTAFFWLNYDFISNRILKVLPSHLRLLVASHHHVRC
jgi:hypothetical protein